MANTTPFTTLADEVSTAIGETIVDDFGELSTSEETQEDEVYDELTTSFKKDSPFVRINSVILTPEVVDDFRKNFDNPSEALARDLVTTMQMDYPEQMAADPNFLTYEGLIGGTAPFLDLLPSTKGKNKVGKQKTDDEIIILFSNAQPATFARPFLSEFAKSVPATEAMAATARVTGPRIIPAATASGAAIAGPIGAVGGFITGTLSTGALSLLSGAGVYLLGDEIEEQILGPDPVITPGQRASYEAYRTLGGGSGAIRFPWLMSPESNIAGQMALKNIANEAAESRAMNLATNLDNLISATGQAARTTPVLTGVGESVAVSGSGIGARYAEEMDPGATGTRLAGELIGGNLLYATVAKAFPRIIASKETDNMGGRIVNAKQRKLFKNINELYADYGTPEQYDALIERLTSPEIQKQLEEAFPGVEFTAAQQGGDLLLMGVEAVKAKGERGLDVARKKAEREALDFMDKFIQGLISTGDPADARNAAILRASIFEDTLRQGLNKKIEALLDADKKLQKQPGQTARRSKIQLSEELYALIGNYITAASNKERELWSAVPNVEIVQPLGEDAAEDALPAFLKAFDEISFKDPAVQKAFGKRSEVLFDFIDDARKDLGLKPGAVLSDAEIDSLGKFKADLDNAVVRLGGFDESSKNLNLLLNDAEQLPVEERAGFLRNRQSEIKASLKDLANPEGQKRLATALDKAADYFSAQATAETRAAQRSGEASEDMVPLTADRLAEVRSQLLREARSLAADPATSDYARRIGIVAEAIAEDLDVEGFGSAYDTARAYSRAKNDFFTRTIVGDIDRTQRSGAARLPAEVTFETFIKGNPSITLHRVRQLQGMAEFADQQGLPQYLEPEVMPATEPVFTTTANLIDSYLRNLEKLASKEVFNPSTNQYTTVINASALEKWKADNAEVLEAFPQLQIDLDNATTAQRAVEVMKQNAKRGRKIARNQEYLAKLIDGVSPTIAVTNAFDSENPEKAFRNLFALRRMGEDAIDGPRVIRPGSLSALRRSRYNEIKAAGLKSEDINNAMQRAILEHAYLAAGSEGAFNPQVFYQKLFGDLPNKSKKSLMDVADQFDVFPEATKNRLKFMSEQLMRVQAADAAGKLADPDAFAAEAGPIVEFYVGVLGSAAGSRAYGAAGGSGPGVISASNVGARELRKFMLELPAVAKLRAIDMMFTDPQLIASLMQKPGNERGKVRQYQKIIGMLKDKLFNASVSMAPFVTREISEKEDRGTDVPYPGFPGLPKNPEKENQQRIEQLRQEVLQQRKMPPANQQGALVPPAQPPTQGGGAAPMPLQLASAAPQPTNTPSGQVDRARFAALFPEDRDLISGIGSLMGRV